MLCRDFYLIPVQRFIELFPRISLNWGPAFLWIKVQNFSELFSLYHDDWQWKGKLAQKSCFWPIWSCCCCCMHRNKNKQFYEKFSLYSMNNSLCWSIPLQFVLRFDGWFVYKVICRMGLWDLVGIYTICPPHLYLYLGEGGLYFCIYLCLCLYLGDLYRSKVAFQDW